MADFISGNVLFLLAIPLTMATILGVFIVIALRRRSKATKMKLGIAPKQPPSTEKTEKPAKASTPAVTPSQSSSPSTSAEGLLNFNIFNKPAPVEKENNTMAEIPETYPSEPINLAAR